MRLVWLMLAVVGLGQMALGAKILALLPMPAKSHAILVERLLRHLEQRGHQLTYITSFLPQKPLEKTKIIHLADLKDAMSKNMPGGKPNVMAMREMSPWVMPVAMAGMGVGISNHILGAEPVKKIIQSGEKFDLILGELFLDESLLAGFSAKFKAPIVALQTFMPGVWANYLVGNPAPAAYIPDPFLGLSSKMTFMERVKNFAFGMYSQVYYTMHHLAEQDAVMRKHFGDHLPPITDILKNTSLMLVNHHHSLGFPRPYVPNMIEIAGFHIDEPRPLPKDLQNYMDSSKQGVILFSLGSNAQSADMPQEKIDALIKAFARFKENVLWKFEADLPNLPKNVEIRKWLPQSDILAHPNLKLFITHGGLLSTTEAVERGVPVVGIPLFGDQPLNMKHTENAGLGKTIDFDEISEDLVFKVVSEVLENPRQVAAAKSKLLNDNPKPAIENAVWWVEYVLRHEGAPHLRSAAQDLAWYQLYLLDVYALAAALLFTTAAINFLLARCLLRKLCSRFCSKTKNVDAKKKKN